MREVWQRMITKQDIKQMLGVDITISSSMTEALKLWNDMYCDVPPWASENVIPLSMPAVIASKAAKMVTIEAEFGCEGSERADFISSQLEPVREKLRTLVEYAAAKGGLVFKPYIENGSVTVEYIQGNCFYPTSFDSNGNITGGVFYTRKTVGDMYYTRVEYHQLKGNVYTIKNVAYQSCVKESIGVKCSLRLVPEWAGMDEELSLNNIEKPLFVYFKMPFANNIDPSSPLGVSIYAKAVNTIKDLDEQYAELIWEYRGGELAIHATEDLFRKNKDVYKLPKHGKRLYRLLESGANNENIMQVFAPAFRDQSLQSGFNEILKQIEQQCGFARGTLSDISQVEKTATEIIHAKQDTYTTVSDIQKSLQNTLEHLMYIIDVWADLGGLAPEGEYNPTFSWDDSIISDRKSEFAEKAQLFQLGIFGADEFRAWYTGEDIKTSRQNLPQSRVEE